MITWRRMEKHLCKRFSQGVSRRISVHQFLQKEVVCVHLHYSCMVMNEGFVTMGKWPTYGPACLHRINPS